MSASQLFQPRSPQFKKIKDYEELELTSAIEDAVEYCKLHEIDFYIILKGVDAYMEKRSRKEKAK